MKHLLSALLALALLAPPSAEAAVIATTKQKKLPTIENAYVDQDLKGFRFDVKKAPTTKAYDVWARVENARGGIVAEWFVKSMKLRHRSKLTKLAAFESDLKGMLAFEDAGTYVLTLFACPANLREPGRVACASASTPFEFGAGTAK